MVLRQNHSAEARAPEPALRDTSAGKALALLAAFGNTTGTATLTDLARWAALPKSTTHRLLALLCDAGFVCRQDNAYYLRSSVLELGALALGGDARALRETAVPYMSDLCHATGQTIHLAFLDGADIVYLEKLHGHTSVMVPSRVGSRLPAHASALGKVLLAFASREQVAAVLKHPLRRMTPRTIAVPGQLALVLDEVRRSAMAYDREEVQDGVSCVAAPIYGSGGSVIAAISVCGRTRELKDARMELLTRRAAHAIGISWSERGVEDPLWGNGFHNSSVDRRRQVDYAR